MEHMVSFLKGEEDSEPRLPVKPRKLRPFSGSKQLKSGEVDFATWRLHAQSLVDDEELKESARKRVLVESLLSPALEVACTLESTCTSEDILHVLDQHFGDVADGYELYSQFRTAVQGMQETASEYLHRLHVLALKAVERSGMSSASVPKEVLRQFESNCADDDLLLRLGVRDMFDKPPAVSDLLHKVRVEESRRYQKKFRLKARTAKANVVTACESNTAAQLQALQKQVECLTLQLQVQNSRPAMGATGATANSSYQQHTEDSLAGAQHGRQFSQRGRGRGRGRGQPPRGRGASSSQRSSYIFCYQCGQDGHFQSECTGVKNPELVQEKLLARGRQSRPTEQSEN